MRARHPEGRSPSGTFTRRRSPSPARPNGARRVSSRPSVPTSVPSSASTEEAGHGESLKQADSGELPGLALVYINAFIPDQGESALGLDSSQPGSVLGAGPPNTVFNFVPFRGAATGDALLYVKPSVFLKGFANDLPAKEGAVLEATQGPAVFSALTAPSGPPAWKTIPSWDLVGTIDNAIPSSIQLFMANRADADITEVKAGHLSMISQPDAVTKVIEEAAQSVAG
jgi:pimeloyl-ACP methyl ester carboxylesterase